MAASLTNLDQPTRQHSNLYLYPTDSLLAASGCMLAYPVGGSTENPNSLITQPSRDKSLYPSLEPSLFATTHHHAQSVRLSRQQKRLCYVRVLTGMLRGALLRETSLLSEHARETLLSGPLSWLREPTDASPPAATDATSGLLSTVTRLTTGTIKQLYSYVVGQSGLNAAEGVDEGSFVYPSDLTEILGWLRIGNLLSELEAMAGSGGWSKCRQYWENVCMILLH